MSNTRNQLIQDASGPRGLGDMIMGTATGGTATTLIDASATSPLTGVDDVERYADHWLYVYAGTQAGVERRISSTTPGALTLTVANAVPSGAYASGDQYEVHGKLRRSDKVSLLNAALTEQVFYVTKVPLGAALDGDGDMEAAGTTKWQPTNVQMAKESSTNDYILNGQQSLRLTASLAGGYAESEAFLVRAGNSYRIEIYCLPLYSGANYSSAQLVIWDQTNGASITVSGETTAQYTVDGAAWKRLYADFTAPATCGLVTVRLTENTNNAISYWDDLIFIDPLATTLFLPSWLKEAIQFGWVYTRSDDEPLEERWTPVQNCEVTFDLVGGAGPKVRISPDGLGRRALYVEALRNYSALDSDTAITNAPLEWVRAALAAEMLGALYKPSRYGDQSGLLKELRIWVARRERMKTSYFEQLYRPARVRMGR